MSHLSLLTRQSYVMDATSFKQLILPHSDAMFRKAYYVTADRDDAMDAVQEAIAALWEHRHELSSVRDIRSYALATAKRQALTLLRRRTATSDISTIAIAYLDPNSDTAQQIEHSDELSIVKKLMESLSPKERLIMKLRAQAECSIDEIASITGLTDDNIRQILSRSRRKLKELYNNFV